MQHRFKQQNNFYFKLNYNNKEYWQMVDIPELIKSKNRISSFYLSSTQSTFINAIKINSIFHLRIVLNDPNFNPNFYIISDQMFPLMMAIMKQRMGIINVLLDDSRVEVNKQRKGINAFYMTASLGMTNVLNKLFKRNSNIRCLSSSGTNCLYEAAKNGHSFSFKYLIEKGALLSPSESVPKHLPPLYLATRKDDLLCLYSFKSNEKGKYCGTIIFFYALRNKSVDLADCYIDIFINILIAKSTLHFCIAHKSDELIELICRKTSQTRQNECPKLLILEDKQLNTPLMASALMNYSKAIQILLKYGADPFQKNSQNKSVFDILQGDAKTIDVITQYMKDHNQKTETILSQK